MTREPDSAPAEVLQVQENRVVVGEWSGDLMELAASSATLREMLRSGRHQEARALVQTRSAAEQAALVALDENPEEVLALTGMDEKGRPGYKPAVVEVLPTEILTDLIVPRSARLGRFNTEVIRAMSPEAFARTVAETLDPVYNPELRTRVSWEWLEAVAALQDHDKAAELLRKVDEEALEEAIMDRLDQLDLSGIVWPPTSLVALTRLAVFQQGFTVGRPGDYIDDAETAEVLDALYEAAPEVLSGMVTRAAKRSGGI